jgi:DNA-binding NarL/FixJ family response regulator
METVKILIADDHELIHIGISNILKSQKRYVIIARAYNGNEAVELTLKHKPDVIFMDISMPELNGINASLEIKSQLPGTKIIALSQHDENEYILQMLKAGGNGYLLKNSKKTEFIDAIETVLQNRRYLSNDLSEQLITSSITTNTQQPQKESIHLTQREIEIIRKIAEGKNNQEIADEFFISVRTVETHRRNLMQKLKVKSVVAMLKYASTHKLIDL